MWHNPGSLSSWGSTIIRTIMDPFHNCPIATQTPITGDFTPHFIAARRGTLTERFAFECRDGFAPQETVFCRALVLNDVGLNVVPRRWI